MPYPRFNSAVSIQGKAIYIVSGMIEEWDQETTMNEVQTIDLYKLE